MLEVEHPFLDQRETESFMMGNAPGGPIPQTMAQTFDGPPTLERSGSEHRRAVTPSRS